MAMNSFDHLSQRKKDQLISQLSSEQQAFTILQSSSDYGVSLNGGRLGSRYAPKAIISQLLKLHAHQKKTWSLFEVSKQSEEEKNFPEAQEKESTKINQYLVFESLKQLIHLGGGHDHIYPLVKALSHYSTKIHVINLDAHLDTRDDQTTSSGTPFRQLSHELGNSFRITQIGIHHYANKEANFQNISQMKVYTVQDLRNAIEKQNLEALLDIKKDEQTILSLDCDALEASFMSAVSAPNHFGISASQVMDIVDTYQKNVSKQFLGIYEYNPLYEDLSCKGARFLAGLLYKFYCQKI